MGTSASSLKAANRRPLTVVSPVSDWRAQDRADDEIKNDDMDSFNHPRLRRLLILQSIMSERHVEYVCSDTADDGLDVYQSTHSEGLLQFLDSAWALWSGMGEEGRDPSGWSPEFKGDTSAVIPPLVPTVVPFHRATNRQRPSSHVLGQVGYYCTDTVTPIFADLQSELHRDAGVIKRVLELLMPAGAASASEPPLSPSPDEEATEEETAEQPLTTTDEPATEEPVGSGEDPTFPSDEVTPEVEAESAEPAAVADETDPAAEASAEPEQPPVPPSRSASITTPSDGAYSSQVIYALTTHPGHHAAHDSFGGYCYVNHVAALANHLKDSHSRVAILDVDYHCGNGTASIFDSDPTVLVVSLHCHPDYDYPFHSGYGDETGSGDAKGTILHLPMVPGMEWKNYQVVLDKGLAKIRNFGATVCLVSLGLDTLEGDPCAIRRAGFRLQPDDYLSMGRMVAKNLSGLPLVIVQEGGYRMDKVGEAAANFVLGCCTEP